MGEKRVIEQIASDEIYNDDWFLKDSVLHDTTKVQPSVIKEYVNQGMATSQDLADEATARQNMDSQLASGIGQQMSNLADFYDTTKSYVVGDVCVLQSGELMRCIAPTSGAFDNTKWEQVTVDELFDDLNFSADAISYDNTSSGLEAENVQDAIGETITKLSAVGSASGDIATFPDGSDLSMPKLEVAIEPQQDLHGYDSPWPAGGGKNKLNLDFTNDTDSFSGLTFSHTDSTFKLKGTVSGQSYRIFNLTLPPNVDLNTDYTLSAVITGTVSRCLVSIYFKNGNTDTENIRVELSDTTPKNTKQFSAQHDNVTFVIEGLQSGSYFDCEVKIQLEKGSSATAWTPYSNICPIIGWSAVDVTRCGAFLISKDDFEQGTYGQHGEEASNIYRIRSNDFIPVIGGKELRLFYSPSTISFSVAIFDSNDTSTNTKELDTGWLNSGSKITIPNNGKYMRILAKKTDNVSTMNPSDIGNIKLFYEDTYSTYTIQLGDTYYGGTLDVVSGVLTVDRAYVDLGTLNWGKSSLEATILFIAISDKKEMSPMMCSKYQYVRDKGFGLDFGKISDSSNTSYIDYIFVRNQDFSGKTTTECASILNGTQLVYELATPLTIQLSPTVVKSLRGMNNVFADTGAILDAEYIRDMTTIIDYILEHLNA